MPAEGKNHNVQPEAASIEEAVLAEQLRNINDVISQIEFKSNADASARVRDEANQESKEAQAAADSLLSELDTL